MPSTEKKTKSELTGVIDAFLDEKQGKDSETDFLSIIDFIERFKLFPNGLFPVQKFILKLYYGIPLDSTNKDIRITDRFNTRTLYEFTEVEYLKYLFNQGRCNIGEQDGHIRHELILVLGRRSGKCVEEGTLVLTDKGLIEVQDLGNPRGPEWQDLDIGIVQENGRKARSAKFYNGGVQAVKRISTYSGYEIGGTGEHRVKVLDSSGNIAWRRLDQIEVGDYVGLNRSTDLWAAEYLDVSKYQVESKLREFSPPSFLDERWGRLLGVLTGDGCWTYDNCVSVVGGCEEFRIVVESMFAELFLYSTTTRKRSRKSTCPEFPWTVRSFSVPARKFLHNIGWTIGAKPVEKHVPWSIFRSPKSVVAAYLAGLFETDGGMEKNESTISFCSASKQLVKQVQTLLLNFGIVARVFAKFNKKYSRNYYYVTVLGYESRVKFAEQIGFLTDRKNSSLVRGIERGCGGHSDTESVPYQRDRLQRLIRSIPVSHNNIPGKSFRFRTWLREACGNCAKPGSEENPSYDRIRKVIDKGRRFGADIEVLRELEQLVDANYFWDPVVSVSDGQRRVFDLNVPDGESFVANGMTNHNSTLSAVIASYELYKLLRRRNPQGHYGIPANNEIRVLCVANDKEQASIVYGDMSGYVDNVDYFKSAMTNQTQTFMKFQTDQDRKKYGKGGRSTIVATFKSSIAKGLRGRGIICYILDEIAFFVDDGKCIKLSSYIRTSSGLHTLEEILNANGIDRSKTGWTDIQPIEILQESGRRAMATRVYFGGTQQTRHIVTKSRYSIDPTYQHRLKVMSKDGNIEWKFVGDIEIGDHIGINRSERVWPEEQFDCSHMVHKFVRRTQIAKIPKSVNPELGEFLGILTGDGTWCSGEDDNLVQVTGGCEQFLPYVEAHFATYFDTFRVGRKPLCDNNTCEISPWSVTKCSQPFRVFLDGLGYRLDVTKNTKSIPWVIFRSPKAVVAAFLRGLFETDGGCEQKGRTVTLASASNELIKEVQLLLLDFGITASIYSKWNRKYKRHYFYLRLIGYESRKIFAREIGFITERKNSDLLRGVNSGRDASNVIPHQYSRLRRIINSVTKARTLNKGNNARSRIIRLCSSSADPIRRSFISYESARRLVVLGREVGADSKAVGELEHICQANYFWDPVVSIGESENEVADLFVPDGHEYVAQGMTNHNSSAEQVYKAVNPSIAAFSPKDPKNKMKSLGPSDGRAIMISSPDAKDGFFYRQYQTAKSGGAASRNMLVIQAPTWEVNPTIDRSYYEVEHNKDPNAFATEHGAEFSDRVRGWIEERDDLLGCIKPELKPIIRGGPRELFWAGVDFGIVKDGTAIALVHFVDGKIELAYHEIWYPRMSWKEANPHLTSPPTEYAKRLETVTRLDIAEIVEWFKVLSTRFFIEKAVFDQWAGPIFEQELHKRDLRQFEMRNFSTADSSQAFHTAKMCMYSQQLSLYDYPVPEKFESDTASQKHSPLITELLELQATSGGKNITVVEAPKIAGKHDDMSDALVRAVLLASEYMKIHPGILEASRRHVVSTVQQVPMPMSYNRYHKARNRLHGVPDARRLLPRK